MQTRSRNTFTTIHTEGSLLPADPNHRITGGALSWDAIILPDDIESIHPARFVR